jgi:hypothetical protein
MGAGRVCCHRDGGGRLADLEDDAARLTMQ